MSLIKKKNTIGFRSLTGAILLVFVTTNTPAYGQLSPASLFPAANAILHENLKIPEALGRVEEMYQGPRKGFVVFVQDAHAHYEAQKHIADILEHLASTYSVHAIGMEGAEGPVDLTFFRSLPYPEIKSEILLKDMRSGGTAGVDYFAMTTANDIQLTGVDRDKLYLENVKQYAELLAKKNEGLKTVRSFEAKLSHARAAVYSPGIREIENLFRRYSLGHMDAMEFLRRVFPLLDRYQIALPPSAEISKLKPLFEKSSGPEKEVLTAMNALIGRLNTEKLYEEVSVFLTRFLIPAAKNENERTVLEWDAYACLLEKGIRLELSRNEAGQLKMLSSKHRDKSDSSVFNLVKEILAFYDTVHLRDHAFVENIKMQMKAGRNETMAFVAGGFHTAGVTEELKKRKISFAVIQPAVSEAGENDLYEKQMVLWGSRLREFSTARPMFHYGMYETGDFGETVRINKANQRYVVSRIIEPYVRAISSRKGMSTEKLAEVLARSSNGELFIPKSEKTSVVFSLRSFLNALRISGKFPGANAADLIAATALPLPNIQPAAAVEAGFGAKKAGAALVEFQTQAMRYYQLKHDMLKAADKEDSKGFFQSYDSMAGLVDALSQSVTKITDEELLDTIGEISRSGIPLPLIGRDVVKAQSDPELYHTAAKIIRRELFSLGEKELDGPTKAIVTKIVDEVADELYPDEKIRLKWRETMLSSIGTFHFRRTLAREPLGKFIQEHPSDWTNLVPALLQNLVMTGAGEAAVFPMSDVISVHNGVDEVRMRAYLKHELVHFLAIKGEFKIPFDFEPITWAVTLMEFVKHGKKTVAEGEATLDELFSEFKVPALKELYQKGKELGLSGETGFLIRPGVSDRKAGYFSIDYLISIARGVYEELDISADNLLTQYGAQSTAGIIMAGVLMGLAEKAATEKAEAVKPLALLRDFFDTLYERYGEPSEEDIQFILGQNGLLEELKTYASRLTGRRITMEPASEGLWEYIPSADPHSVDAKLRFVVTDLYRRPYDGANHLDIKGQREAARERGLAQIILTVNRVLHGKRDVRDQAAENKGALPEFRVLWDTLFMPAVIASLTSHADNKARTLAEMTNYRGAPAWIAHMLRDRYNIGNKLVADALHASLPLHLRYLDSLLYRFVHFDGKEETLNDARVRAKLVEDAIFDSAGVFGEKDRAGWAELMLRPGAIDDDQALLRAVEQNIWPHYEKLFEEAKKREELKRAYERLRRQDAEKQFQRNFEQLTDQELKALNDYFDSLPEDVKQAIQKQVEQMMDEAMEQFGKGQAEIPGPGQGPGKPRAGKPQGKPKPGEQAKSLEELAGQLDDLEQGVDRIEEELGKLSGKIGEIKSEADSVGSDAKKLPQEGERKEEAKSVQNSARSLQDEVQKLSDAARSVEGGAQSHAEGASEFKDQLPSPETGEDLGNLSSELADKAEALKNKIRDLQKAANNLSRASDRLAEELGKPARDIDPGKAKSRADAVGEEAEGMSKKTDEVRGPEREMSRTLEELRSELAELEKTLAREEAHAKSGETKKLLNDLREAMKRAEAAEQAEPKAGKGEGKHLPTPPPSAKGLDDIVGKVGKNLPPPESRLRPKQIGEMTEDELRRAREAEEAAELERTGLTKEERKEYEGYKNPVENLIRDATQVLEKLLIPTIDPEVQARLRQGPILDRLIEAGLGEDDVWGKRQYARPRRLILTVLIDRSGSMGGEKILAAKIMFTALLEIIFNLNQKLEARGYKPIEFEVGLYEDSEDPQLQISHQTVARDVKPWQKERLIYTMLKKIESGGGTNAPRALNTYVERMKLRVGAIDENQEDVTSLIVDIGDRDMEDSDLEELSGIANGAAESHSTFYFPLSIGDETARKQTQRLGEMLKRGRAVVPKSFADAPNDLIGILGDAMVPSGLGINWRQLKGFGVSVIPAQAGIQELGPRFRGGDIPVGFGAKSEGEEKPEELVQFKDYRHFFIKKEAGREFLIFKKKGVPEIRFERGPGGAEMPDLTVPDNDSNEKILLHILKSAYRPNTDHSIASEDGQYLLRYGSGIELEVLKRNPEGEYKLLKKISVYEKVTKSEPGAGEDGGFTYFKNKDALRWRISSEILRRSAPQNDTQRVILSEAKDLLHIASNGEFKPVDGWTDSFTSPYLVEADGGQILVFDFDSPAVGIIDRTDSGAWRFKEKMDLHLSNAETESSGKIVELEGETGVGKGTLLRAAATLVNEEIFFIAGNEEMSKEDLRSYRTLGQKQAGVSGRKESFMARTQHYGGWIVVDEINKIKQHVINDLKSDIASKKHEWYLPDEKGILRSRTVPNHPRARIFSTRNPQRAGVQSISNASSEDQALQRRKLVLQVGWLEPNDEVEMQFEYAQKEAKRLGIYKDTWSDAERESYENALHSLIVKLVNQSVTLRLRFMGYDVDQEQKIRKNWNLLSSLDFKPKNAYGDNLKRPPSPRAVKNIVRHFMAYPFDRKHRSWSVIHHYFNFDAEIDSRNTYASAKTNFIAGGFSDDTNLPPLQLTKDSFQLTPEGKLKIVPFRSAQDKEKPADEFWASISLPLHPDARERLRDGILPAKLLYWLQSPQNTLKFYQSLQAISLGRQLIFVGEQETGKSTLGEIIAELLGGPELLIQPVGLETAKEDLIFHKHIGEEGKAFESGWLPGPLPQAMNTNGHGKPLLMEETPQGKPGVIAVLNEISELGYLLDPRTDRPIPTAEGFTIIHLINPPGIGIQVRAFSDEFLERHHIESFTALDPLESHEFILQASRREGRQVNTQLIGEMEVDARNQPVLDTDGEPKWKGLLGVERSIRKLMNKDRTKFPRAPGVGTFKDIVRRLVDYFEFDLAYSGKLPQEVLLETFVDIFTMQGRPEQKAEWRKLLKEAFKENGLWNDPDASGVIQEDAVTKFLHGADNPELRGVDVITTVLKASRIPKTGDRELDSLLIFIQENVTEISVAWRLTKIQEIIKELSQPEKWVDIPFTDQLKNVFLLKEIYQTLEVVLTERGAKAKPPRHSSDNLTNMEQIKDSIRTLLLEKEWPVGIWQSDVKEAEEWQAKYTRFGVEEIFSTGEQVPARRITIGVQKAKLLEVLFGKIQVFDFDAAYVRQITERVKYFINSFPSGLAEWINEAASIELKKKRLDQHLKGLRNFKEKLKWSELISMIDTQIKDTEERIKSIDPYKAREDYWQGEIERLQKRKQERSGFGVLSPDDIATAQEALAHELSELVKMGRAFNEKTASLKIKQTDLEKELNEETNTLRKDSIKEALDLIRKAIEANTQAEAALKAYDDIAGDLFKVYEELTNEILRRSTPQNDIQHVILSEAKDLNQIEVRIQTLKDVLTQKKEEISDVLSRAESLSTQTEEAITRIPAKAVAPTSSLQSPWQQLPEDHRYSKLMQLILKAHGDKRIRKIISFDTNGWLQHVLSVGDGGEAHEFVSSVIPAKAGIQKIGIWTEYEDKNNLAAQIRKAHRGSEVRDIIQLPHVHGRRRFLTVGEKGAVYEYEHRFASAKQLHDAEELWREKKHFMIFVAATSLLSFVFLFFIVIPDKLKQIIEDNLGVERELTQYNWKIFYSLSLVSVLASFLITSIKEHFYEFRSSSDVRVLRNRWLPLPSWFPGVGPRSILAGKIVKETKKVGQKKKDSRRDILTQILLLTIGGILPIVAWVATVIKIYPKFFNSTISSKLVDLLAILILGIITIPICGTVIWAMIGSLADRIKGKTQADITFIKKLPSPDSSQNSNDDRRFLVSYQNSGDSQELVEFDIEKEGNTVKVSRPGNIVLDDGRMEKIEQDEIFANLIQALSEGDEWIISAPIQLDITLPGGKKEDVIFVTRSKEGAKTQGFAFLNTASGFGTDNNEPVQSPRQEFGTAPADRRGGGTESPDDIAAVQEALAHELSELIRKERAFNEKTASFRIKQTDLEKELNEETNTLRKDSIKEALDLIRKAIEANTQAEAALKAYDDIAGDLFKVYEELRNEILRRGAPQNDIQHVILSEAKDLNQIEVRIQTLKDVLTQKKEEISDVLSRAESLSTLTEEAITQISAKTVSPTPSPQNPWQQLPEDHKYSLLIKEIIKFHQGKRIRKIINFDIKGIEHVLSVGDGGEAHEFIMLGRVSISIESTDKNNLTAQIRKAHRGSDILDIIQLPDANSHRRFLTTGTRGKVFEYEYEYEKTVKDRLAKLFDKLEDLYDKLDEKFNKMLSKKFRLPNNLPLGRILLYFIATGVSGSSAAVVYSHFWSLGILGLVNSIGFWVAVVVGDFIIIFLVNAIVYWINSLPPGLSHARVLRNYWIPLPSWFPGVGPRSILASKIRKEVHKYGIKLSDITFIQTLPDPVFPSKSRVVVSLVAPNGEQRLIEFAMDSKNRWQRVDKGFADNLKYVHTGSQILGVVDVTNENDNGVTILSWDNLERTAVWQRNIAGGIVPSLSYFSGTERYKRIGPALKQFSPSLNDFWFLESHGEKVLLVIDRTPGGPFGFAYAATGFGTVAELPDRSAIMNEHEQFLVKLQGEVPKERELDQKKQELESEVARLEKESSPDLERYQKALAAVTEALEKLSALYQKRSDLHKVYEKLEQALQTPLPSAPSVSSGLTWQIAAADHPAAQLAESILAAHPDRKVNAVIHITYADRTPSEDIRNEMFLSVGDKAVTHRYENGKWTALPNYGLAKEINGDFKGEEIVGVKMYEVFDMGHGPGYRYLIYGRKGLVKEYMPIGWPEIWYGFKPQEQLLAAQIRTSIEAELKKNNLQPGDLHVTNISEIALGNGNVRYLVFTNRAGISFEFVNDRVQSYTDMIQKQHSDQPAGGFMEIHGAKIPAGERRFVSWGHGKFSEYQIREYRLTPDGKFEAIEARSEQVFSEKALRSIAKFTRDLGGSEYPIRISEIKDTLGQWRYLVQFDAIYASEFYFSPEGKLESGDDIDRMISTVHDRYPEKLFDVRYGDFNILLSLGKTHVKNLLMDDTNAAAYLLSEPDQSGLEESRKAKEAVFALAREIEEAKKVIAEEDRLYADADVRAKEALEHLKKPVEIPSEPPKPIRQVNIKDEFIFNARSPVHFATHSPDGRFVVTVSEDKKQPVILWDAFTGLAHAVLYDKRWPHTDKVTSARFSHDGKLIATTSRDGTVKIWDVRTGKLLKTLRPHKKGTAVYSVAWSPDSAKIVTAGEDGTARVTHIAELPLHYEFLKLGGHGGIVTSVAFSPNSKLILTTSADGKARIWDANDGKLIRTVEHGDWVAGGEFSPDGQNVLTVGRDNTAKVTGVTTGATATAKGHERWLSSGAYSRNGKKFVTASDDKTAIIWETETGKLLQVLGPNVIPAKAGIQSWNSWVTSASFSPDEEGKFVVTAYFDGNVRLWDAETGELLHTFDDFVKDAEDAGKGKDSVNVFFATFGPHGNRIIAAGSDGTARVWEFEVVQSAAVEAKSFFDIMTEFERVWNLGNDVSDIEKLDKPLAQALIDTMVSDLKKSITQKTATKDDIKDLILKLGKYFSDNKDSLKYYIQLYLTTIDSSLDTEPDWSLNFGDSIRAQVLELQFLLLLAEIQRKAGSPKFQDQSRISIEIFHTGLEKLVKRLHGLADGERRGVEFGYHVHLAQEIDNAANVIEVYFKDQFQHFYNSALGFGAEAELPNRDAVDDEHLEVMLELKSHPAKSKELDLKKAELEAKIGGLSTGLRTIFQTVLDSVTDAINKFNTLVHTQEQLSNLYDQLENVLETPAPATSTGWSHVTDHPLKGLAQSILKIYGGVPPNQIVPLDNNRYLSVLIGKKFFLHYVKDGKWIYAEDEGVAARLNAELVTAGENGVFPFSTVDGSLALLGFDQQGQFYVVWADGTEMHMPLGTSRPEVNNIQNFLHQLEKRLNDIRTVLNLQPVGRFNTLWVRFIKEIKDNEGRIHYLIFTNRSDIVLEFYYDGNEWHESRSMADILIDNPASPFIDDFLDIKGKSVPAGERRFLVMRSTENSPVQLTEYELTPQGEFKDIEELGHAPILRNQMYRALRETGLESSNHIEITPITDESEETYYLLTPKHQSKNLVAVVSSANTLQTADELQLVKRLSVPNEKFHNVFLFDWENEKTILVFGSRQTGKDWKKIVDILVKPLESAEALHDKKIRAEITLLLAAIETLRIRVSTEQAEFEKADAERVTAEQSAEKALAEFQKQSQPKAGKHFTPWRIADASKGGEDEKWAKLAEAFKKVHGNKTVRNVIHFKVKDTDYVLTFSQDAGVGVFGWNKRFQKWLWLHQDRNGQDDDEPSPFISKLTENILAAHGDSDINDALAFTDFDGKTRIVTVGAEGKAFEFKVGDDGKLIQVPDHAHLISNLIGESIKNKRAINNNVTLTRIKEIKDFDGQVRYLIFGKDDETSGFVIELLRHKFEKKIHLVKRKSDGNKSYFRGALGLEHGWKPITGVEEFTLSDTGERRLLSWGPSDEEAGTQFHEYQITDKGLEPVSGDTLQWLVKNFSHFPAVEMHKQIDESGEERLLVHGRDQNYFLSTEKSGPLFPDLIKHFKKIESIWPLDEKTVLAIGKESAFATKSDVVTLVRDELPAGFGAEAELPNRDAVDDEHLEVMLELRSHPAKSKELDLKKAELEAKIGGLSTGLRTIFQTALDSVTDAINKFNTLVHTQEQLSNLYDQLENVLETPAPATSTGWSEETDHPLKGLAESILTAHGGTAPSEIIDLEDSRYLSFRHAGWGEDFYLHYLDLEQGKWVHTSDDLAARLNGDHASSRYKGVFPFKTNSGKMAIFSYDNHGRLATFDTDGHHISEEKLKGTLGEVIGVIGEKFDEIRKALRLPRVSGTNKIWITHIAEVQEDEYLRYVVFTNLPEIVLEFSRYKSDDAEWHESGQFAPVLAGDRDDGLMKGFLEIKGKAISSSERRFLGWWSRPGHSQSFIEYRLNNGGELEEVEREESLLWRWIEKATDNYHLDMDNMQVIPVTDETGETRYVITQILDTSKVLAIINAGNSEEEAILNKENQGLLELIRGRKVSLDGIYGLKDSEGNSALIVVSENHDKKKITEVFVNAKRESDEGKQFRVETSRLTAEIETLKAVAAAQQSEFEKAETERVAAEQSAEKALAKFQKQSQAGKHFTPWRMADASKGGEDEKWAKFSKAIQEAEKIEDLLDIKHFKDHLGGEHFISLHKNGEFVFYEWYEDLKQWLGIDSRETVRIFSDSHVNLAQATRISEKSGWVKPIADAHGSSTIHDIFSFTDFEGKTRLVTVGAKGKAFEFKIGDNGKLESIPRKDSLMVQKVYEKIREFIDMHQFGRLITVYEHDLTLTKIKAVRDFDGATRYLVFGSLEKPQTSDDPGAVDENFIAELFRDEKDKKIKLLNRSGAGFETALRKQHGENAISGIEEFTMPSTGERRLISWGLTADGKGSQLHEYRITKNGLVSVKEDETHIVRWLKNYFHAGFPFFNIEKVIDDMGGERLMFYSPEGSNNDLEFTIHSNEITLHRFYAGQPDTTSLLSSAHAILPRVKQIQPLDEKTALVKWAQFETDRDLRFIIFIRDELPVGFGIASTTLRISSRNDERVSLRGTETFEAMKQSTSVGAALVAARSGQGQALPLQPRSPRSVRRMPVPVLMAGRYYYEAYTNDVLNILAEDRNGSGKEFIAEALAARRSSDVLEHYLDSVREKLIHVPGAQHWIFAEGGEDIVRALLDLKDVKITGAMVGAGLVPARDTIGRPQGAPLQAGAVQIVLLHDANDTRGLNVLPVALRERLAFDKINLLDRNLSISTLRQKMAELGFHGQPLAYFLDPAKLRRDFPEALDPNQAEHFRSEVSELTQLITAYQIARQAVQIAA